MKTCDEGETVISAILIFLDTGCPIYRVVSWELNRIGSVRPPGNLEVGSSQLNSLKILEVHQISRPNASFLRNKAAVRGDTIRWTFCIRWLPYLQISIVVIIHGLLAKRMWFNTLSIDNLKTLVTGCVKHVKKLNING